MKLTKFPGVFEIQKKRKTLLTKNLTPGKTVYTEKLVKEGKDEFREWDPKKSKLAAAILKGVNQIGFKEGDVVLYLGAASGTTVSHVSDIVGEKGLIFALDFAPRVLRQLVYVSLDRKNVVPILADANKPEEYLTKVCKADIIYQDIAQKNQAEIFLKNIKMFLKERAYALLAVKSRSVDVAKKPGVVFKEVRRQLEKEVIIVDFRVLDPFERDHCMFVCKKK